MFTIFDEPALADRNRAWDLYKAATDTTNTSAVVLANHVTDDLVGASPELIRASVEVHAEIYRGVRLTQRRAGAVWSEARRRRYAGTRWDGPFLTVDADRFRRVYLAEVTR